LKFIDGLWRWNWGALFWGWLWALGHRLWGWAALSFILQWLAYERLAPLAGDWARAALGPALLRQPAVATLVALLVLAVPYVATLPLALVGTHLAWKHRPFPSMEIFLEVQRRWAFWGWWTTLSFFVLYGALVYLHS
jgi:hypothetical protein